MQKYLNFKNKIDYEKLENISKIIKNGNIVVFPTDTVYGIGTNGLDEIAIKKLYEIKKRDSNKPISLLVNSIDMINEVAENITEVEYALIKKFLPGPLTIILKKKKIVPNILTANSNTVGIRIPSNKIALELINYCNVPIATSSANISNKPNGINLELIMKEFKKDVDYFIDAGISDSCIASTVVQVINGVPYILREGAISEKEINDVCLKVF